MVAINRNYWVTTFKGNAWKEFLGRQWLDLPEGWVIAGFPDSRKKLVQGKMRPGDYLLCYQAGDTCWVGLLEVMESPYYIDKEPLEDDDRIWPMRKDIDFRNRVKAKVVVNLTPASGLPIAELGDQLSIMKDHPLNYWKGFLSDNPRKLPEADGIVIMQALQELQGHTYHQKTENQNFVKGGSADEEHVDIVGLMELKFSSSQLTEGTVYTREELRKKFSITDATLNTGIFQPPGSKSIWLFVTENKTHDRTQYHDLLDGDTLYWEGQTEGTKDFLIIDHELNDLELLVFYRKKKYEFLGAGFLYMGSFRYVSHIGTHPTRFVLQRISTELSTVEKDIQSFQIEESYQEGKLSSVLTNKHERNPKLRAAAIKIHGTRCQVCGFSYSEAYGVHGKDFIEVHHLYPVSHYTGEISVDPSKDMAVLCANCHRMIHRWPDHPLSLDELRKLVATNTR